MLLTRVGDNSHGGYRDLNQQDRFTKIMALRILSHY